MKMDWSVSLLLIILITAQNFEHGLTCGEDVISLGMQSGRIKNSSLTSSSFLPGHEAYFGRLDSNNKHWSWCPSNPITEDVYEWIQIDFTEISTITHIVIGGEFNDGEGTRFASRYRVEYQRREDDPWLQWHLNGTQIFDGNVNTRSSKILDTKSKLIATRLRVIPVSSSREEVCLRLEFYGCTRHGVASYSAPQGDSGFNNFDFIDHDYDGRITEDGLMTGGLGMLTNKTLGGDYFDGSPLEWLGWRYDVQDDVTIIFEMDHLRNISEVRFHCDNQHTKDVRVFRKASFYASNGAVGEPLLVYEYVRDSMDLSREVHILLDNVITRFITVKLEFAAKWIMMSEVFFISELVVGDIPPDTTSSTKAAITSSPTTRLPYVATTRGSVVSSQPFIPRESTTTGAEIIVNVDHPTDTAKRTGEIDSTLIGIIVGSCLGVILVVLLIIIVCCIYQRKKLSPPTSTNSSAGGDSTNSIPPVLKTHHADSSEYDLPWGSRPLPHPPPNGATMQSSGYASEGYGGAPYASIPIDQYNNCQLTPIPQSCLHHYMTSGGLLTLPGVHHDRHQCSRSNTLPAHAQNNLLIPVHNKAPPYDKNQYDLVQQDSSPYDQSNYRSSPTVPLPNIQSGTGSSVYGVPAHSQLDLDIPTIPYDSLRFIEILGSGQYGEVHLCRMTIPSDGGEQQKLVAMKKLQPSANESNKADFLREIKIMSRLRHSNIIQVIGLCTDTADSPCVVAEYMSMGDLNQFLQRHVPEGTALLNKQTLNQSTLLHMTAQIALGMSYLEQLNVTHRDLAARNCLVGDNYQVKISDFGMSRSLYSQQYYKVEGRVVLPIRWMAWESVLLGKFTTKSDVWSFGVTLWEIFSFAREQPFTRLSDDDVIGNCMNYYSNNMAAVVVLNQPSQCTKEIYDLMRACWNHNDFHRPTFKDISLFLTMKSPSAQKDTSSEPKTALTRLTTC